MMPNDPNQHWSNLNNQVSQYQQASNMNQPAPRQVMSPQDREMVQSQQNDQFTLGAMNVQAQREGVQAQREGNRLQADATKYAADTQKQTWDNKNQLDFQNAEKDRAFQQANIDKERESRNNRAQVMMDTFNKAARARLDTLKANQAGSLEAFQRSRQLQRELEDLERVEVTAELKYLAQFNKDVMGPLNQKLAQARGQQSQLNALVDRMSSQDGAVAAGLGQFVSQLESNRFTAAPEAGWWNSMMSGIGLADTPEDLAVPGSTLPLLQDLGGLARNEEVQVGSGVTVSGVEQMARALATQTLPTTLMGLGGQFKDGTGKVVDEFAKVLANSALNLRGDLEGVKADFEPLVSALRQARVSPDVIPTVFEQIHARLVAVYQQKREGLAQLIPSVGASDFFDISGQGDLLVVDPTRHLSPADQEQLDDTHTDLAKLNALAVMANAARRAGVRAGSTGYMMSREDLESQIRMLEQVSLGMDDMSFSDVFRSDDPYTGVLSRDHLDAMLAQSNPMGGRPEGTDFLYDLAGRLERLTSEGKSHRRSFRDKVSALEDEDELLRAAMANNRSMNEMGGFEAMLSSLPLGAPDMDPESVAMLMQILSMGEQ